jgi:hypothetical protein
VEERHVFLARVVIVEHGVAVAERAAFAILSAQAHGRALDEEGPEGERFAETPVDRAAFLVGLRAVLEEALDLGVEFEVGGNLRETGDDAVDRFGSDTGIDRRMTVGGLEEAGGAFVFFRLDGLRFAGAADGFLGLFGGLGVFEVGFERGGVFGLDGVGVGLGDRAFTDQFFGEDGRDLRVRGASSPFT